MSCMYVLWDVIGVSITLPVLQLANLLKQTDDTVARKVNSSDASAFAKICGCCPSQGPLNSFFLAFHTHNPCVCSSLISVGRSMAPRCVRVFRRRHHRGPRRLQAVSRSAERRLLQIPPRTGLVLRRAISIPQYPHRCYHDCFIGACFVRVSMRHSL